VDAISSNSNQKESKRPFEQQLSYISECISFIGKNGLTPTLNGGRCYVIFDSSVKGIFSSFEM